MTSSSSSLRKYAALVLALVAFAGVASAEVENYSTYSAKLAGNYEVSGLWHCEHACS